MVVSPRRFPPPPPPSFFLFFFALLFTTEVGYVGGPHNINVLPLNKKIRNNKTMKKKNCWRGIAAYSAPSASRNRFQGPANMPKQCTAFEPLTIIV